MKVRIKIRLEAGLLKYFDKVRLYNPLYMYFFQLDVLRSLQHCGGNDCIMDNYRPPLPLGNRKVRSSHPLMS